MPTRPFHTHTPSPLLARLQRVCGMALLLGLLLSGPAHAARLALVVGNDAYQKVEPLKNARNDARLMASVLQKAGFDVTQASNLGREGLWSTIDTFKGRINKGDEVVFYFAGHGVQMGANQLLLPTDIEARNEAQVQRDGVPLIDVQDALKEARVALLLLDACRDNPFPKTGTRAVGASRGLSPPEPSTGQIIMMSAGRNQKALDYVPGQAQGNGLFTWELSQVLQTPGIEIRAALEQVKERVDSKARQAGHEQRPSLVNDLSGNFYLTGGSAVNAVQMASVAPEPARPSAAQLEQQAWEAAQSAGTAAALQAYVSEYPRGAYAGVARVRLAALARPVQPEAVPQPAAALVQNTTRQPYEPEMVRLPAGSFTMGSPASEVRSYDSERPQRRVDIKAFELGKTEVTQGQWKAVMGSNPSAFSQCGDTCPVERVSWDDIQQYLQKLNQKTGQRYRLPSEAEWEYAARAGCDSAFNVGGQCAQKIEASQANFNGSTFTYNGSAKGEYREKTTPVGSFQANNWGLFDMHGNVYEWVQDVWHDNYNGAPTDGSAWVSGGDQSLRVLRGGSWLNDLQYLRSGDRIRSTPAIRYYDDGFRLARTVP